MDERDIRVKVGTQPVDERRRERDLRDEHEHRPAGLEGRGDRLDVDRGLAPRPSRPRGGAGSGRRRPARSAPCPRPEPARRSASSPRAVRRDARRFARPAAAGAARGSRSRQDLAGTRPASPRRRGADRSGPGNPLGGRGGQLGQGVLLARAERRPSTAAGSAAAARPDVGRIQRSKRGPAPAVVSVQSTVTSPSASSARSRRSRPARPSARQVPGGSVPAASWSSRSSVDVLPRAAAGGACRRPLDDQLEPFEHPRREHRREDQGWRDEIVAGDPAREGKRQRGSSGPSARTRAASGFASIPLGSVASPSTTARAWRRPNSTITASPASTSASSSGTAYVYVRMPPPPPRRSPPRRSGRSRPRRLRRLGSRDRARAPP